MFSTERLLNTLAAFSERLSFFPLCEGRKFLFPLPKEKCVHCLFCESHKIFSHCRFCEGPKRIQRSFSSEKSASGSRQSRSAESFLNPRTDPMNQCNPQYSSDEKRSFCQYTICPHNTQKKLIRRSHEKCYNMLSC